jgi:hypothetical protein
MLRKYVDRAIATVGVSFIGRLGSYRYLDMDVTIGEALSAAETMLECIAKRSTIPVFFVPPLRPQHPRPRAPQGSKTEREAPRSRPTTSLTISLQ